MREYRTIIPFIKENLGRYIIGLIALFVVDIASLIMPQVLRAFGDWAQLGELTLPRIAEIAVTILVLGLFVAMGRFGWRKYIFGTARRLEYWLRDRLFGKYLTLDDTFFNHHRTGDLMAHATNDVLMVRNSMGGGIIMIVDAVFMTIFTVGMMIYTVGLRTAAVALLALPFLTVMVYGLTGPLQRRSRDVQDTFSEMTTEVQENISGMASIKAFGIEADRADAFNVINERYREKNLRLVKISAFFDPLISLISGVAFVIFLFYGVRRIIVGELSLGDFIAVISYLNMMVWPLIAMGMVVSSFQRGIAAMTRINEIFAAKPRVQEGEDTAPLRGKGCQIEFRDVWFRYGDNMPWVLEGVSFTVEPHESLAILGRTGSGKTTILNLLLRRYDVDEGQILINGIDIRDISYEDLSERIAYVEQESFLFSRTIAGNIAFSADAESNDNKVREAAEFSQVVTDIEGMPDGFETWVGERGVTLSGGQKQRVAIARAYYQQTDVLVLDDSLSAVDTNTEKRILNQLQKIRRSLILVSQRVSSVQESDTILVLEDGKISQRGTHRELMQDKEGFYAQLFERQLLEMELSEADGVEAKNA